MQLRDRRLPQYRNGVKEFLDFAYTHTSLNDKILCPCVRCNNCVHKTRDEVKADLLEYGIVPSYEEWLMHGEDIYVIK